MIEAGKGALVLVAGFGLLSLVHHDVQRIAERLIAHGHLNPASHYPRIFIDMASHLTDARLVVIGSGVAAYAFVLFVEAYGLWNLRRWAEWLAALHGGIYVPFEVAELYERITWLSVGAFLLNLAIVAFMLYCVFDVHREKPANPALRESYAPEFDAAP